MLQETDLLGNIQISDETGIDYGKVSKTISSDYLKKLQLRHFILCDVLPGIGFATAIILLWHIPISSVEIVLFTTTWILGGLGITVGYHRLFTHRCFKTNVVIRVILTIFGSMAAQGPLPSWVALHRRHHEYSDTPGDPHSPNLQGDDFWGKLRGLLHAHFTWMMSHEYPNIVHYAPDILRDQAVVKVSRFYHIWVLLGLIVPAIIDGLISRTLQGAFLGFLWGGLVRIFWTGNIVWSINSLGHIFGSSPFNTQEKSKNNFWLALPSFGESWHHNHHAFQNSAKFGLRWWQIDFGYWVIFGLEAMGLAWEVKAPTSKMIEAKLR